MQRIRIYAEIDIGIQYRREWLWAEVAAIPNHARIVNIPLTRKYGLGDIVEYDPDQKNRIIHVVLKGSKTAGGVYESTGDKINDRAAIAGIKCYLKQYAIRVEFLTGRIFVMSIPLNMTHERLMRIVVCCPVVFEAFLVS